MRVRIRTRSLDVSRDARLDLERRLRLLLGRHAAEIVQADVMLEQGDASSMGGDGSLPALPALADEPDERNEIRCGIRTRLRDGDELEVGEQAPDFDDAVFAAMWRLQHRLHRHRLAGPRRTRGSEPEGSRRIDRGIA